MSRASIEIKFDRKGFVKEHYGLDENSTEEEFKIAIADDIVNNPELFLEEISEAEVFVEIHDD